MTEKARAVIWDMDGVIVDTARYHMEAWQRVFQSEPGIELYDTDGEHASPSGSYLAACVFYAIIQGTSPVDLPHRISMNGDVLADISKDYANSIQKAAWWAAQNQ